MRRSLCALEVAPPVTQWLLVVVTQLLVFPAIGLQSQPHAWIVRWLSHGIATSCRPRDTRPHAPATDPPAHHHGPADKYWETTDAR